MTRIYKVQSRERKEQTKGLQMWGWSGKGQMVFKKILVIVSKHLWTWLAAANFVMEQRRPVDVMSGHTGVHSPGCHSSHRAPQPQADYFMLLGNESRFLTGSQWDLTTTTRPLQSVSTARHYAEHRATFLTGQDAISFMSSSTEYTMFLLYIYLSPLLTRRLLSVRTSLATELESSSTHNALYIRDVNEVYTAETFDRCDLLFIIQHSWRCLTDWSSSLF